MKKSLLWLSAIYLVLIGIALFDQFARGGLTNEGAAGLSLLAHLPALPLSFLLNIGLETAGQEWLLAPFSSGLSNVLWLAVSFWALAVLQWSFAVPAVVRGFRGRKGQRGL